MFHDKTRRIEVNWHFMRQKSEDNTIEVKFTLTVDQLADILTKALSRIKFERWRDKLCIKLEEETRNLKRISN